MLFRSDLYLLSYQLKNLRVVAASPFRDLLLLIVSWKKHRTITVTEFRANILWVHLWEITGNYSVHHQYNSRPFADWGINEDYETGESVKYLMMDIHQKFCGDSLSEARFCCCWWASFWLVYGACFPSPTHWHVKLNKLDLKRHEKKQATWVTFLRWVSKWMFYDFLMISWHFQSRLNNEIGFGSLLSNSVVEKDIFQCILSEGENSGMLEYRLREDQRISVVSYSNGTDSGDFLFKWSCFIINNLMATF